MEQKLEQIREQQKATWNKFSPGWKKWDDFTMEWLKPMGDEIVRSLAPKKNEFFLDVAGGTGEPALTIAALLTGGKIIVTDLAEGMIEITREKAATRGITNVETSVCDVCELPFADNTFDGISCRFGFMFFPDMLMAAKEMVRVLKPGGRVSTAVWGVPEKNFWITAIMGILNKNMELPTPPPGAPGMFRCAKEGFMMDLFREAGLKNSTATEVIGRLNCGTTDNYWNFMTEVAAPVVAALSKADDTLKQKIKDEVYEVMQQRYPGGGVVIDTGSMVIYGEK